jgi:DNA-binding NtrC family response regulator
LSGKILIAEDERNLRRVLRAMLVREGYEVTEAADGAQAVSFLAANPNRTDVLISDIRMPKMDGLALFRHCRERHPSLPVILVTAYGTIGDAVEAIRSGAFDYITKPFDEAELLRVVGNAVRTAAVADGEASVDPAAEEWFGMVGRSPAWMEVRKVIEKAAMSPFPVLITGDGTGRSWSPGPSTGSAAGGRTLHQDQRRSDPPTLWEAEVFGYEKGRSPAR